jgi:hypothetical protein
MLSRGRFWVVLPHPKASACAWWIPLIHIKRCAFVWWGPIVRYRGVTYESPSHAGKAVVRRAVNGWWFWKIERGKGNWVRLTKVRRAGTPLYT